MTTIQITINEALLTILDDAAPDVDISRFAFTAEAIEMALRLRHVKKLEERHALGYALKSPMLGEFDGWESEQVWANG